MKNVLNNPKWNECMWITLRSYQLIWVH